MKSTGIIKCVGRLGRVVLPKELRGMHEIQENDPMEIFTEGEN